MDAQLQYIKLADIVVSKTQPRKFFDQRKIDELADSITQHGVIQPVRLRPRSDGKYELVCGERRFRASKQAGRKTIPAVISELSDQEVREIQLIENFQREDVHPMEEAVAILSAITLSKYSVEDLANKVGKSKKYIAQRLKLNDLLPDLQTLFYENKINLTGALKIVTVSTEDQKKYLANLKQNEQYYSTNTQIDYFIKQSQGNLDKAVFNLEDPTLSDLGACTTCPFNSRNANLLFPDDSKEHICMNKQDYQLKTKVHYERGLEEALKDPAIVLVSSNYTFSDEEKKLISEGNVVLKRSEDYDIVKAPVKEELNREEFDSQEEFEDSAIESNQAYEKEMLDFERKQNTGKLVKAFVVAGDQKGAHLFVELKKKGEQKNATTLIHSGDAAENDIVTEINRLEEREARAKELDDEKIHSAVKEIINTNQVFLKNTTPFSQKEYTAAALSLWEAASFEQRRFIAKELGFDTHLTGDKLYDQFDKGTDDFARLLRLFILGQLSASISRSGTAAGRALHELAEEYVPDQVKEIIATQNAAADKRISRLNTRIEDLKKQQLQLQESKTSGKKKSVKDLIK